MISHGTKVFFLSLILACGASAQIDSPNFRYVAINFPGAVFTAATGINNLGTIVGYYEVGTNCFGEITPTCRTHGFILSNKNFIRFDIPGSRNTFIFGVNDFGDTVGTFQDSAAHIHGFLHHHTGQTQLIDPSGALFGPPSGINNSLVVVGGNFAWYKGKFTRVDFTTPGNGETQDLTGISNANVIVGSLFHQDFWNGILVAAGDFDLFPRINGSDTHVNGINIRGDVVGTAVIPGTGFYSPHVEAGELTGDKPDRPLRPIPVHFPGANQTAPNAINRFQAIVGSFLDSKFHTHGFLAVH